MDNSVRERLIEQAEAIARFRDLEIEEKEWLFPLLNRRTQSTLEILDLIAEKEMTFEEIAVELDMNPQTVSQKLNALAKGGYPLALNDCAAFAPTGRPRKLARKSDIAAKLKQILDETQ